MSPPQWGISKAQAPQYGKNQDLTCSNTGSKSSWTEDGMGTISFSEGLYRTSQELHRPCVTGSGAHQAKTEASWAHLQFSSALFTVLTVLQHIKQWEYFVVCGWGIKNPKNTLQSYWCKIFSTRILSFKALALAHIGLSHLDPYEGHSAQIQEGCN